MSLPVIVERWQCPDCGLFGATASGPLEADTNIGAHARVVGCDLTKATTAPADEWTAGGRPAAPPR